MCLPDGVVESNGVEHVVNNDSKPVNQYYGVPNCSIANRRLETLPKSYIVTDSGAEMTTLGSGWRITKREDMPSVNIGGPSKEMGRIHMYRGSGITKVKSVNKGYVILRAENNSLIYPEELRHKEKEMLFCLSQLGDHNIKVDDYPLTYGGSQCLLINDDDDKEVLISLTYKTV